VAPTTSRDDIIGQTRECELLVAAGKLPQVVAFGKVYEKATTLPNVPLSPDVAKVTVEKVRVPDARVPLPSDEVTTVAKAFQTFVAWPRHLIRFMPQPHVIIVESSGVQVLKNPNPLKNVEALAVLDVVVLV